MDSSIKQFTLMHGNYQILYHHMAKLESHFLPYEHRKNFHITFGFYH